MRQSGFWYSCFVFGLGAVCLATSVFVAYVAYCDQVEEKAILRRFYPHLADEQFNYFYRHNRLLPPRHGATP